jgi:integrase
VRLDSKPLKEQDITSIFTLMNNRSHRETRSTAVPKEHLRYWRKRIFKQPRSPYYQIQIQCHGERHMVSLETSNPDAAAARARTLYEQVKANGWAATLDKRRQTPQYDANDCSLGAYIAAIASTADINKRTLQTYCRAIRKIASDLLHLPNDGTRYNYASGGSDAWRDKVDTFRIEGFTSTALAMWKKRYLEQAQQDPVSQRSARVSANFFLRNAKSLFGAKIREHIGLVLPDPLPFAGVRIERIDGRYFATFSLESLIATAQDELAESDPEAFKVLLLAGMAGLRRREIDLLPWSAFRWAEQVIRIETTRYFVPKTKDSVGDVLVDSELMSVFRGYRGRASKAEFVIQSENAPRRGEPYRCDTVFKRLTNWLRAHGVSSRKPLHELRKSFGSEICQQHGIHQASIALRHSDIRTTSAVYVDSRPRNSVGLGHLLSPAIVDFTTQAKEAL